MRESLRKENSPLKNLGKVHHTVKWQKKYFITFGLILQKASSGQKILGKNQRRHVFFKMTGSAISVLAVTMSAADTPSRHYCYKRSSMNLEKSQLFLIFFNREMALPVFEKI